MRKLMARSFLSLLTRVRTDISMTGAAGVTQLCVDHLAQEGAIHIL